MPDYRLRDRLINRLVASWSIADDPVSQATARAAATRDVDTVLTEIGPALDLMREAAAALADLGACDDPACAEPTCSHVLPRIRTTLALSWPQEEEQRPGEWRQA